MFNTLRRTITVTPYPLVEELPGREWQKRLIRMTPLGEQVLLGNKNWLDYTPEERWVGGVRIIAGQSPWVVTADGRVWRR
ncbi:hypothetical protein KAM380_078740 [Aeromonas caviae]|nr:hypothetical protein KAM380_078740 [Aeromonas caviae]